MGISYWQPSGGAADLTQARDRTTHTGTQVASTISDFAETSEDITAAMFTSAAHSGLTAVYVDNGTGRGTLALTATGGGGSGSTDPEVVRDVFGAAIRTGVGIQVFADDANDIVTFTLVDIAISQVANLQTVLDGKVPFAALSGKADLVNGVVPVSQLPGFVSDVIEVDTFTSLPATGTANKLYLTRDNGKLYRWGGSVYAVISDTIALGETAETAYRGDRGKIAFDHTSLTNNPHGVTKSQVGLGNVNNTSDEDKPLSLAQRNALSLKSDAPAIVNLTSAASLQVGGGALDNRLYVSALGESATIAEPSGSPVNGNRVLIRIKDNGTARALTWNAIWRGWGVTLPTTTTAGKGMRIAAEYNSQDSRWDVLSIPWED